MGLCACGEGGGGGIFPVCSILLFLRRLDIDRDTI